MRLGGASIWAALVFAGSAGAVLYVLPAAVPTADNSPIEGVRRPLFPEEQRPRVTLAAIGDAAALPSHNYAAMEVPAQTPVNQAEPLATNPLPDPQSPATASTESEDDGEVTPTLEGRMKGPGKRGLIILQIGDSHTSADFLTGELRRRLQARYGRGAPGYVTAGHPHIGVRSSSLNIKASPGWTYKSLQRTDAVPAEFWLSGYNAVASVPGETLTFSSPRPQLFDMIEIEVLRQPEGGRIDVKLDGVVETSYDLASRKTEPVVILDL